MSRNYLDLPLNVRVRRAGTVMKGCSLLFGFFLFLKTSRQYLLGPPGSVSVQGTQAMRFPTATYFYLGEKHM